MNSDKTTSLPFVLLLLGITLVGLLAGLFAWKTFSSPTTTAQAMPPDVANHYIPDGRPVVGIQMTDQDGQPFTEARFKGKWSFLFFGFTHCPDVCPTTLLILKTVWDKLPAEARQAPEPQMIFVSVDPERDTPALLKSYTHFYNPEFMGMTGPADKLDILTTQVGALYGYEDGDKEGEYTVNHSAQIVLIDPKGRFRAVFTTPHQVDEIVNGFVAIRDYYAKHQESRK